MLCPTDAPCAYEYKSPLAKAPATGPKARIEPVMFGYQFIRTLPNIQGWLCGIVLFGDIYPATGCFSSSLVDATNAKGASGYNERRNHFDALGANSIYSASNTVQPKSLNTQYLIRY